MDLVARKKNISREDFYRLRHLIDDLKEILHDIETLRHYVHDVMANPPELEDVRIFRNSVYIKISSTVKFIRKSNYPNAAAINNALKINLKKLIELPNYIGKPLQEIKSAKISEVNDAVFFHANHQHMSDIKDGIALIQIWENEFKHSINNLKKELSIQQI